MTNIYTEPVDENAAGLPDYFILDKHQDLFLKNLEWDVSYYEMLVHRIYHSPDKLRYHIGLINLLIRENQSEALQGALVDLFIVVGNKAKALRVRMLEQARKCIPNRFYMDLKTCLQNGIGKTDCYPAVSSSCLGFGFTGSDKLVEKIVSDKPTEQSMLEDARECIQVGQIKQARQILEKSLLKTPGDTSIASELAEIYCHARDKQALDRICRIFLQQGMVLPKPLLDLTRNMKEDK